MSIRLLARTSAAPTGRVYVKFDFWDFYEYVSWESVFYVYFQLRTAAF